MNNEIKSFSDNKKKDHISGKKIFMTVGPIIILILSAVTFIFVPAMTNYADTEKLPPVGKYDGKKIEYAQGTVFAKMVEQYAQQAKAYGQEMNEYTQYVIFNNAFTSTVINMAFSKAVEKSRYIVPDTAINRFILPYFSDSNGNYSAKIFRDTQDSAKVELKKEALTNLAFNRYTTDTFGDTSTVVSGKTNYMYGPKISSRETSFIADMNNTERSFDLVSYVTTDYPKSEAAEFGKANTQLFVKYNMSLITSNTEEEAKKISTQLAKNEILFNDAITSFSTKRYSDANGKLTNSFYYQLKNIISSEEDLAKVIVLNIDEISDPIKTSSGYVLFKCDAVPEQPDFSLEATIDTAYSYMTVYENGKIEDYFTNKANDFTSLALKDGFDAAATEKGLKKQSITAFPINYSNNELLSVLPSSDILALSNAQSNENFLKTAFSLKPNEISSPIVIGKNIIVLKLTEEVKGTSTADSVASSYTYYTTQFDQNSVQRSIMDSKKLENNLYEVLSKYFFTNN